MAIDRFRKVDIVLAAEFPDSDTDPETAAKYSVGLGKAKGDQVIAYQEQADMLIGDDFRQVRTIGVRIVAVAEDATKAMSLMTRATEALENAPNIRVFELTGVAVDQDNEGPDPSGMFVATQRCDVR